MKSVKNIHQNNFSYWLKKTFDMSNMERFYIRNRLYCKDGFNLSIQGNEGSYSTPRQTSCNYENMEIGFPSEMEELLMGYAENPDDPTNTVYGYVPVLLIEDVIKKHGGINMKESLFNKKN